MEINSFASKTMIIQSLAREAPRVVEILRLLEKGYEVVFAPDFSEIHGYILPLVDIVREVYRGDEAGINRSIRNWYAAKLLLESRVERKSILPSYWAEMSQSMHHLMTEHSRTLAELSTSGQAREDLEHTAEWLVDDPSLRKAIDEFGDSTSFADAKRVLSLAVGYLKPIGILAELVSGSWREAFDRLDSLWEEKLLDRVDAALNVHAKAALKDAGRWASLIEGKPEQDDPQTGYRYASFIDGWAIGHVIRANKHAIKDARGQPLLFMVTRSERLLNAVQKTAVFRIGEPPLCFNAFWRPDTFLAYQVIRSIPDSGFASRIEAARELESIDEFLRENCRHGFDPQDFEAVSDLRRIVWSQVNKLVDRIENISIYGSLNTKRWEEWDKALLTGSEDFAARDVVNFVRVLVGFTTREHDSLLDESKKELERLWRRLASQDEEIAVFKGFQAFIVKPPSVMTDKIGDTEYLVADMPGQSVWVRFRSSGVKNHIACLERGVRIGEPGTAFLTVLGDLSKTIGTTTELNPECHLLLAVCQLVLDDHPGAQRTLTHLERIDSQGELAVETAILHLALSVSQPRGLAETISSARLMLQKRRDVRLMKTLGFVMWRRWITTGRSEIETLRKAVDLTAEALNKTSELGQFQLECLNNLSYFRLEMYDLRDESVSVEGLAKDLCRLRESFKSLKEPRHADEIRHTIGKLCTRIAVANRDLALMDAGIQDMEQISHYAHRQYSDASADLVKARRMRQELAASLADQ